MSVYDDPVERKDLINSIFLILNNWKIDLELQVLLVGLPAETKSRELTKIKNGKAFPNENDFMLRAVEIISISKALQLVFPSNRTLADLWVTTSTYTFADRAPVEVMLGGIDGLKKVHQHLRGGGWQ